MVGLGPILSFVFRVWGKDAFYDLQVLKTLLKL